MTGFIIGGLIVTTAIDAAAVLVLAVVARGILREAWQRARDVIGETQEDEDELGSITHGGINADEPVPYRLASDPDAIAILAEACGPCRGGDRDGVCICTAQCTDAWGCLGGFTEADVWFLLGTGPEGAGQ